MDTDFDFDMTLDHNGILLFRFSGTFDVDQWAAQQRAATARLLAKGFNPTCPVVADLREFRPPQGDWHKIARLVFRRMETLDVTRKRCALITGGNPGVEIACRFYIVARAALFHRKGETRNFSDFAEGYAWAAGALAGPMPSLVH